MQPINSILTAPAAPQSRARTAREDMIEQIVAATDAKGAKARELARLLAVGGNTLRWTATEYHALLRKKDDPGIRNYSAFVWWQAKVMGK